MQRCTRLMSFLQVVSTSLQMHLQMHNLVSTFAPNLKEPSSSLFFFVFNFSKNSVLQEVNESQMIKVPQATNMATGDCQEFDMIQKSRRGRKKCGQNSSC